MYQEILIMKKLFILLIVLNSGFAFAQEKCHSVVIIGEAIYEVRLSLISRNVVLYVGPKRRTAIRFGTEQRNDFSDFISSTYTKYIDWEKKAIENKTKGITKTIDQGKFGHKLYFMYGDLQSADGPTLVEAHMSISDSGEVSYYLSIPSRISDSNQFIKSEREGIFFRNKAEVDALLTTLSTKCINEYIVNESKKEE